MSEDTKQEYACQIPAPLADDLPAAASFLRHHARDNGWLITGEPYIRRSEPMNFGTPENPVYLDEDPQPYITVCAVAEKAPPKPLPTFVPSTETVEKAARTVAHSFAPEMVWDDEPAHVKNYYAVLALDVIVAAGQHLVADALGHLANHGPAYGIDATGTHRAAAGDVRRRLKEES